MQTRTLPSGPTIRYFADLDEFPAERRSWFTRYQLEAAEFPKTPAELIEKFTAMMGYYNSGELVHGNNAAQNIVMGVQAVWAGYVPDELSVGALLHDANGELVTDLSPDGLGPILKKLAIPTYIIREILEDVKKNSGTPETSTSLGLRTMPEYLKPTT